MSINQKDALFSLIKSMTRVEKGYFKKSCVQHGLGKKSYLSLYDALDKLKSYDEKALLKKHKKARWLKNLAINKIYLKNLILDALANFNSAQQEDFQLYNTWNHYKVLKQKGMTLEAKKVLLKLKKQATRLEDFGLLIQILNQEKNIILQFKAKDARAQLHQLDDELNHTIDLLHAEIKMLAQYYECFSISYSTYGQNEKLKAELHRLRKEIESSGLNPKKQSSLFQRSLCGFYENYYIFFNQRGRAFQQLTKLGKIYEKHAHLKSVNKSPYQSYLTNYVKTAIRLYKFQEADLALTRLERHLAQNKNNDFYVRERYVHFKLLYYKNQGHFDEAVQFYNEALKQYDFLKRNEINPFSIFVYLDLCFIYAGLGQYARSLDYVNRLLNDYRNSVLSDFLLEVRLLNLIIHFEMHDTDFILNQTTSFIRSYTLDDQERAFELTLVRFLRKLIVATSKKLKKEIYQDMKKELALLSTDKIEVFIIDRLKISEWIESKIHDTTIAFEIQNRIQHRNAQS